MFLGLHGRHVIFLALSRKKNEAIIVLLKQKSLYLRIKKRKVLKKLIHVKRQRSQNQSLAING